MTLPALLSRSPAACPVDEQLVGLLQADDQTDELFLVGHLNQCESCRRRLEGFAAADDEWQEVRRHLTAMQYAESPPLERLAHGLTASLRGATLDTTRIRDGEHGPSHWSGHVASAAIPTHVGPYRIESVLGYGGMGIVYKGWDDSLHRHVAIKVINDTTALRGESHEEFRREARAVAAVRSPYVIAIHAIADQDTPPYLVMEYVPGESLEQAMQRSGQLPWQEAARIGSQIAKGLSAAHAAGVIHRDVKPGNVLLEAKTGHVKLGDFGLAHSLADGHLTRNGCVKGTPEFISPEQAESKSVTAKADLFSLGSVLYAALGGTAPFHADTPLATLRKTIEETPRPLTELCPDLPAGFDQLVTSLLSKRPGDRAESACEVAEFLERIIVDPKATFRSKPSHGAAKALAKPLPQLKTSRWTIGVGVALSLSVLLALMSFSFFNGVLDTEQKESTEIAGQQAEKKDKQQNDGQPPQVLAPARVQIVSPEDVLKERIRQEKDRIELARHPLLVRQYEGHKGPVSSFTIDPKQEFIISSSGWPEGDRTARVWDFKTGKEVRQFDTAEMPQNPGSSGEREAPGEFAAVTLSADATEAITGSTGGAVCIWDVATGKLSRQFTKHTASVYALTTDDDNRVLSAGRDQVARLWDLKTGNVLLELAGNRSHVRATAISPDGKTALTGGLDKVLRYWDLTEPKLLHEFPQDDWVWSVKFMPGGKSAVVASGKHAKIIDLEEKTSRMQLSGHAGTVTSVDRSEDGRWIATSSYDRKVRLWSADTGKLAMEYTGHRDWVWKVAFTPDGEHLMSAGGGRYTSTGGTNKGVDFALRLWRLPPAEPRVITP